MSDALEALRSEIEEMRRTGRTPSEVSLELILVHASPEVARSIWYCAIPRWFNLELIEALRSRRTMLPSPQALLDELLSLPFVREYPPFGYTYHDSTRQHLLERWRKEDTASFLAWNRRAQGYFEKRLRTTTTSRFLGAAAPGAVVLAEAERDQYQRELMYHRLVVDPEKGFQEFQDLFRKAERNRQFAGMQALLLKVSTQAPYLSGYRQAYLTYYSGVLALRSGRLEEAQRIFLALRAETIPLRLQSKLCYRMGELTAAGDQDEQAIQWYKRSLDFCKQTDECHSWEKARTLRDLGNAYQKRSDWRQAEIHYLRSLEEWKRAGDPLGIVETYNDLGTLYLAQDKPKKALEFYEECLTRLQNTPDQWRIGRIYNNLGNYYSDQKKWMQALEYFDRSLVVKSSVGDRFGMATTHLNIANVYYSQGKEQGLTKPLSKKSEEFLRQAAEYFKLSLGDYRLVGDRHAIASTLYYLASTYRALARRDDALQCVDEAIVLYRSLKSDEVIRAEELREKLLAVA